MIRALGYSENPFDVKDPGRLCRGRERWIEPYEDDTAAGTSMVRTVVSGASFSDDGAADARRGTASSGIDPASVIVALFPGRRFLGFMEDGHPADIPESAEAVEAYEGYRAGGRQELGLVRWHVHAETVEQLRALIGDGPEERIRGFAVLSDDTDEEALLPALFSLVGFSTLDSPPARYQPMALPQVLSLVDAVVLFHRDKHGPAVSVYSREPIPDVVGRLALASAAVPDVLRVPFAIPPMLARWDRALAELRAAWPGPGEFPVPKGPPPSENRRGRRRWRGDEDDDEAMVSPLADEPPPIAEDTGEE